MIDLFCYKFTILLLSRLWIVYAASSIKISTLYSLHLSPHFVVNVPYSSFADLQTIFTKAATVPKNFFLEPSLAGRLETEESEEVQRQILATAAKELPVENRTISGN